MLTGRAQAFLDPAHYDDVSGYTNPKESEHDLFTVGHTSTSLSLASGVAKARDLKDEAYNVVAVIGDGSLSGGMAYEGLNQIATEGTNTIVVINDNDQSIAVNPTGGIYTALRDLRESNGQADNNLFKALGFDYHYLDAGNDLDQLIALFEEVKDASHPVCYTFIRKKDTVCHSWKKIAKLSMQVDHTILKQENILVVQVLLKHTIALQQILS